MSILELIKQCTFECRADKSEATRKILELRRNIELDEDDIIKELIRCYGHRFTVLFSDLNNAIIKFCKDTGFFKKYNDVFEGYNAIYFKELIVYVIWAMVCLRLIKNDSIFSDLDDELTSGGVMNGFFNLPLEYRAMPLDAVDPIIEHFNITVESLKIADDYGAFNTDEFCYRNYGATFRVADIVQYVIKQDPLY